MAIDLETQILQPVFDAFGAVDLSELPQEVVDQYNKVKNDIGQFLGVGGDTAESMGIAIGGGIYTAFANGDPAAAVKGLESAMAMALTAAGGPVGAAAAAGVDAVPAILSAIGGSAHGGTGACGDCATNAQVWYGGFDIAHEQTPLAPTLPDGTPDKRWLPWTNQTTRGPVKQVQSDGSWIICADDVPTNLRPYSPSSARSPYTGPIDQVNNPPGSGHVVSCSGGTSGSYAWLPSALTKYPAGSFDAFLLETTWRLLEKYLNAQGPQPSYQFVPGGATINLRTLVESALVGWNALHQGPAIPLNEPSRLLPRFTTFGGKTSLEWYVPTPDIMTIPGSVAAFYMLSDSVNQDTAIYTVNTGPLIPSLAALYAMKPSLAPIKMKPPAPAPQPLPLGPAHLLPLPVHLTPGSLAPSTSTRPAARRLVLDGWLVGGFFGAVLGGPLGAGFAIGSLVGGTLGYLLTDPGPPPPRP